MVRALAGVDGENREDDEEANENNQNDGHSFADGLFERVHIRRTGDGGLGGDEGRRHVGEEDRIEEEARDDMIEGVEAEKIGRDRARGGHLEKATKTEEN